MAMRGRDVAIVDAGDDLGDDARLRLRIWDRLGELVGRAEPVAQNLAPVGAPALLVHDDGSAILVTVPSRQWDGTVHAPRMRAECR